LLVLKNWELDDFWGQSPKIKIINIFQMGNIGIRNAKEIVKEVF